MFASLFLSVGVFSQENAYSSFDVSLRNSIKFNKFLLNPAFSYARESTPTITLVNRRQWVKFENSPQLYFANYLGSLGNNSRFGVGVYQQSLGLLKNFGGVLNYAYNIPVGLESNLTFGINTYFYNSTFDFSKVITVVEEPLLQNQKSNSLIAIKPGINLGTEFFDFGVSVNNLVLYNLATSEMVKDNQENSYMGYAMYTGYVNSYNDFLEDAKFSTLFFVEKNKDATALAANLLLDIPNKAWLQGGYNTLYGFSAGVGITLSERFSLGYNYDIGLGDVSQLGSSHEFLLSYKFDEYEESNRYYQQVTKKPKATTKKVPTTPTKTKAQIAKEKADQLANAKLEKDRLAREAAEKAERDRLAAEEAARLKAEQSKEVVNTQAEIDRLAAEEAARLKAAADKAAADAAAQAQAEKDRLAAEAEARRKAINDKARADAAKAKAERDRLAR
ncbi:PorP/SprF family type IX secretion system membrane protein, partial [Flavobacterium cucumis]|uniref:PorP/SprF family type IX secretion system membrane protein n=1 Tax=Flavobacterium cucumis TaxID=416016 RepID=UPI0039F017C9